jgi:hypothetical protein
MISSEKTIIYTGYRPCHIPSRWRKASAAKLQGFRALTDDNVREKIAQRKSELTAPKKMP